MRLPGTYVKEALTGVAVSEIGRSADETRLVLRTYVPVVIGPKRASGVVALEQEYAPIEAAARGSAWLVAGVLEALLLLLLVIFIPVLARVSHRIRRHVQELEHVATHDELTGLPNRLGFRRIVEEVFASERPVGAVLLVDLDGFSEINEVLGSESGDALLSQVADRLQRDLHQRIARVGEDEFGVALTGAQRAETATVAGHIERALAQPFLVSGARVAVTASFGAALLPEHGADQDTLLRRAGMALTTAKEPGQSKLQIYDPDHEASDVSRLALIAELREALEADQLLVHYQPQLDLATRAVRGVEALVRWQHPERGLLTASSFIVQAERSGLATEVRAFVLDTAARQWQEWKRLGIELELAVNLSTVDMLDVSLPDEIASLLARYRIPPWNLVLEITERTIVGDQQRTGQIIDRLAQLGIRLAIDDFGTGQSSLASVRQFPVEQIKLDRALLACVPGDPAAEVIVKSCVEIAHAIGATVVAEGIETQEQRKLAFALGCDIAQGYLIGRALPAEKLTALLQEAPGVSRGVAA
jgi:diguanylate cyclase (GGDEF)-like protein